jgi:hypothetical protein
MSSFPSSTINNVPGGTPGKIAVYSIITVRDDRKFTLDQIERSIRRYHAAFPPFSQKCHHIHYFSNEYLQQKT